GNRLFMDIPEAYIAARRSSALIDLSARGKLAVRGADRASYLQGLQTNDVEALSAGEGCYAMFLTPQGRIESDAHVFHLGDELLLDVHPSVAVALEERLREFVFTEDVTVDDRTSTWVAFGVHGPGAAAVVGAVVQPGTGGETSLVGAAELVALSECHHRSGQFAGEPVVVARSSEIGEVGFVLYTASANGPALRATLMGEGAVELDASTFDLLRIEAGRPVFPADLDSETIPLEAGLEDRAISMTKGCYVGQEVIVRILHRGKGRVARRLVGLGFEPDAVPPLPGATLSVGADESSVGVVTSAARSPALGRSIALGYVKRELADVDTRLVVQDGEGWNSATVTARPFLPLDGAGR
ncbi:MAG: glycine cleavage T C-terminal barrel domain-containing protein, partial [bacterium]